MALIIGFYLALGTFMEGFSMIITTIPVIFPVVTALGFGLTAIVEITLDRQDAESLEHFETRVAEDPAVQQCYRVSPGPDLVLLLWLPDMAAYHALVQRLFTQDANVRNLKSYFVTHRAKFAPAVRLPGSAG